MPKKTSPVKILSQDLRHYEEIILLISRLLFRAKNQTTSYWGQTSSIFQIAKFKIQLSP